MQLKHFLENFGKYWQYNNINCTTYQMVDVVSLLWCKSNKSSLIETPDSAWKIQWEQNNYGCADPLSDREENL